MEATMCDTKGCGAIIKGEQTRAFTKRGNGCELQITLIEAADRCPECSRKMFAKAASAAWDELKRGRKGKEETADGS